MAKGFYEHPVAAERRLLCDLVEILPAKANAERLALVYSHLLFAYDTAEQAEPPARSLKSWAKTFPWLTEKQLEHCFTQLAALGMLEKDSKRGKATVYYPLKKRPDHRGTLRNKVTRSPGHSNPVTGSVVTRSPGHSQKDNNDLKALRKNLKQPEPDGFTNLSPERSPRPDRAALEADRLAVAESERKRFAAKLQAQEITA